MLGVDREASRDEIRRSYRRMARRYHPDAAARVSAGVDIVRVNEAWRVLRDPALRRRYDAGLRARPVVPFTFDDREGWGQIFDPVFAPVQRRPRPPAREKRPPRRVGPVSVRALALVGLLVVLVALFVFTAYAGGGGGKGTGGATPADAPVGSCVTIPSGQDVKVVPCGLTNDGQVVAPIAQGVCPAGAAPTAADPRGASVVCLVPH